MIREHKVELIDSLRADGLFVLQHVHARNIVELREYQRLMENPKSEDRIVGLLDLVLNKGEESCSDLIRVFEDPEILRTFPNLKNIK